jgi:hypothetical protein
VDAATREPLLRPEEERRHADRYAARLRSLGIHPDDVD